jgi:hypothetical protein
VLPVGDLQVEFVIRLDDKFTFALTDKMADIDLCEFHYIFIHLFIDLFICLFIYLFIIITNIF